MSASSEYPGLFVTLEGGEGAGKSTQARGLRSRLQQRGFEVVVTREPGGSPRAEFIRSALLSGAVQPLGILGEAMMFAAARLDHVDALIRPALERGAAIVCDRFIDSTRVYQGGADGLDHETLSRLEEAATGGCRPDLTLVLDLPAELGAARAAHRRSREGQATDRFEDEDLAFHARVRDAFLAIAAAEPERCTVIDAAETPDLVERAIWRAVEGRLLQRPEHGSSRPA